jgi:type IV fimbrial biogenesis protein FimT
MFVTSVRGVTLIELVVTLAVFGLLFVLSAPSVTLWIRNSQVRTVAEGLQNGLRLAQNEAARRNRQVVFSLTNATPALNAVAAENGRSWSIQALPLMTGGADAQFIQGGALGDVASGVMVAGPSAICFNPLGRLVAAPSSRTGVSEDCLVNAANPTRTFDVSLLGADRPLRVVVSIGGQVRMCDPARTQSATQPDGCPAA